MMGHHLMARARALILFTLYLTRAKRKSYEEITSFASFLYNVVVLFFSRALSLYQSSPINIWYSIQFCFISFLIQIER